MSERDKERRDEEARAEKREPEPKPEPKPEPEPEPEPEREPEPEPEPEAEDRETEEREAEDRETEEREAEDRETEEREAEEPKAAADAETEADTYDPELAPALWQRFDLLLAIGALAILSAGTLYYRSLTAPSLRPFVHAGLRLELPAGWLPGVAVETPMSALASLTQVPTITAAPRGGDQPQSARHEVYASPRDPDLRIEVQVARKPAFNNLRSALTLDRAARYGGFYWASDMGDRSIGGRDWLETRYQYAHRASISSAPSISSAIEYAILNGNLLYVVTLHGDDGDVKRLEELVAPTLRVDPNAEEAN